MGKGARTKVSPQDKHIKLQKKKRELLNPKIL